MGISKLSKQAIFISVVIFILICYTYKDLYQKQEDYESNKKKEIEECKNSSFVAQDIYWIHCDEYNLQDLASLNANIIRNGKIVKTFYKESKKDKYFSFTYKDLMKSDTIEVIIKKDVYYIHSFKNDFWLGYKPQDCFLKNYRINTVNKIDNGVIYKGKHYSLSPVRKKFYLKRKDLNNI